MKVRILAPSQVIFEGEASSVFLPGDRGEFELLDHHAPIISLLSEGLISIDWSTSVPVRKGIVKFDRDECLVIVEE